MSFTGTVENGVVKLPANAALPDGTKVRVEPITRPAAKNQLTKRLVSIASKTRNLPADLAAEHDHYIHGTPKRAK
jgi:predicted DNA-binding antitoxin AbrB/MazE fold protein